MQLDEAEKALLAEALLKSEEMRKEIEMHLKIISVSQEIVDVCEVIRARNLNIIKLCERKKNC